jgi:tetratricopeptide (TPR) repeat protein
LICRAIAALPYFDVSPLLVSTRKILQSISFIQFSLVRGAIPGMRQEDAFPKLRKKLMLRHCWLMLSVLCLGCHSLTGVEGKGDAAAVPETKPLAVMLWEKGQAEMRDGEPEQAIRCYEQSLAADASLTCNYLSLAAAYLECGKDDRACEYLGKHVDSEPNHLAGRAHYAELLFKRKRLGEARVQFERFARDAQETNEKPARLIHAFSRLMEIALDDGNDYEEHLYRGIGLYLLACRSAELADPDGDLTAGGLSAGGLLWKAALELKLAQQLQPGQARPCWYLYSVWWAMGKQQPAQRWLRRALDNASFSTLTPAEQRGLHLAGQSLEKRL